MNLKLAERSEAKNAKESFASKISQILKLDAQPFLAKKSGQLIGRFTRKG